MIRRVDPNSLVPGHAYNELANHVERLYKLSLGALLEGGISVTGVSIAVDQENLKRWVKRLFNYGEVLELQSVQGARDTDKWEQKTDNRPVKLRVITDWQYDTTTHKLSYRTRTLTFNAGGWLTEISEESELVEVHEAKPCPE